MHPCVCVCVWEREGGRETQRERQRDRERQRETERDYQPLIDHVFSNWKINVKYPIFVFVFYSVMVNFLFIYLKF